MRRPLVVSLSSSVLAPTVTPRLIEPMPVTPLAGPLRSTARSTTSPGTSPVAFVVSRLVEPRAIWTVPAETGWFWAGVERAHAAHVPRPAMLAAAPTTAAEASSFGVKAGRLIRMLPSGRGERALAVHASVPRGYRCAVGPSHPPVGDKRLANK